MPVLALVALRQSLHVSVRAGGARHAHSRRPGAQHRGSRSRRALDARILTRLRLIVSPSTRQTGCLREQKCSFFLFPCSLETGSNSYQIETLRRNILPPYLARDGLICTWLTFDAPKQSQVVLLAFGAVHWKRERERENHRDHRQAETGVFPHTVPTIVVNFVQVHLQRFKHHFQTSLGLTTPTGRVVSVSLSDAFLHGDCLAACAVPIRSKAPKPAPIWEFYLLFLLRQLSLILFWWAQYDLFLVGPAPFREWRTDLFKPRLCCLFLFFFHWEWEHKQIPFHLAHIFMSMFVSRPCF